VVVGLDRGENTKERWIFRRREQSSDIPFFGSNLTDEKRGVVKRKSKGKADPGLADQKKPGTREGS